jgi:membrane-bound lytic murein transglycosylase MltF
MGSRSLLFHLGGGWMGGKGFSLVLAMVFVLAGCTPVDESVVKRGDLTSGEGAGRVVAVREAEPALDLDPALQAFIRDHGATVKKQASKYGFDWRLILAMVKQESRFTPEALSEKGASGLMQLMPTTGEEVARTLSLSDIEHPEDNIKGGVYYLKTLYGLFQGVGEPDRTKLALAAYNAGIGRIYDAQELAAYLNENPARWSAVRDALPLLSKRYYTLHRNVWEQEKPRAGWFGNSRETVQYVDTIIQTYDELRMLLN